MKKTNLLFTLGIVAASVAACDQISIPSNSNSTKPSASISESTSNVPSTSTSESTSNVPSTSTSESTSNKPSASTSTSTSGTITPDTKENLKVALEKAKVSVGFNGSITSIYVEDGDNSSEGDLDITITDNFMQWKKNYSEFNGDELKYDYIFVKDKDGKMSYNKLNLMNEIQSYQFINPRTDTTMDYDSYCLNPFKNITADDFSYIEERYYLSEDKVSAFNGLISLSSTQRFSYYDFEVASVSLGLGNKRFTDIIITTQPRSDNYLEPSDFFLDCTFSVVCAGELDLPTIKTAKHRDEHDILKAALKDLKESTIDKKNYTITAVDSCADLPEDVPYDNYATEDGFYSDFKAAYDSYRIGYKYNEEDGKFHKYTHYVSGPNASIGDGIFDSTGENPEDYLSREELEPNFLGFAPEFFLYNEKNKQFYTTNSSVVDEIHRLISPFYDRYEPYYNASKVFFNLDESNKIISWGWTGRDMYATYEDTMTYTIKNVGTTVLPTAKKNTTSDSSGEDK